MGLKQRSRALPAVVLGPWRAAASLSAALVRQAANRQALGYFYFEEAPGRRSAAKLLTKDEARRIARQAMASLKSKGISRGRYRRSLG